MLANLPTQFVIPSSLCEIPSRSRLGLFLACQWRAERIFLIVPAQTIAAKWLESFKEFPPRQKPASFSLDQVMEKMTTARPNQN